MRKIIAFGLMAYFSLTVNEIIAQKVKSLQLESPCSTTGITEKQTNVSELNFSIYPNPSNGSFYLKFSQMLDKKEVKISIYNELGMILLNKQFFIENDQCSLDIIGAKPGLYFTKALVGNQVIIKKLIIN